MFYAFSCLAIGDFSCFGIGLSAVIGCPLNAAFSPVTFAVTLYDSEIVSRCFCPLYAIACAVLVPLLAHSALGLYFAS